VKISGACAISNTSGSEGLMWLKGTTDCIVPNDTVHSKASAQL
jgi:hypothetical protein